MPKKPKTRTVYRDKRTGRFASKATWKRSRARGGKNYVRSQEPIKRKPRAIRPTAPRITRPATRPRKTEYQINVIYEPNKGAKVEVQISAIGPSNRTREQVLDAVEYRMQEETNPKGRTLNIVFWEKFGKQFFGTDDLAWFRLKIIYPFAEKEVYDKTKGRTI
jgi:hypothetical protein